jgi:putative transposase
MNQQQENAIEYLREEHRVLRLQLDSRRLSFADGQRPRLTAMANPLGRKRLARVATVATPETLLKWYRKLIASKYDGRKLEARTTPSI